MKKQCVIPIFVPHLGCPNDCVFCNQKSISGQTKEVTGEIVKETIEEYLAGLNGDIYKEVAFYGGSFTGIDKNKQEELLSVAYEYVLNKQVDSIRISTRPDYINKEILKMLKKYKVKTIELGVQSTDDYILKRAGRGHTFQDIKKASKLIRWYGFELGHQIMVGLPDSTKLDEEKTARDIIKLKPKIVRIYPVLVIKHTQLEKEYEKGEYEPLSLVQAVERCKELVNLFNQRKIKVIRIGLQNTQEISDPKEKESEVVAGPFHPAFRQLVESSIWYDRIVEKIKSYNVKVKEVQVTVHSSELNNVVGHKKENIEKLQEIYDVSLKVVGDNRIKIGSLEIEILKTYQDFLEDEEEQERRKKEKIKR